MVIACGVINKICPVIKNVIVVMNFAIKEEIARFGVLAQLKILIANILPHLKLNQSAF